MNQRTRNIISLMLAALIVSVNIAELGAMVHHWDAHVITHQNVNMDDEHNDDCESSCSHIITQSFHQLCEGHYLNFMPQIKLNHTIWHEPFPTAVIVKKSIFFRVRQYSSSYTHLFTSRPPPTQV